MNTLNMLWRHRYLINLWTRYNIQSRYVEAKLGLLWVIVQPVIITIIYTIVFSELLQRPPAGGVPFSLFFLSGLTVWQLINSTWMKSSLIVVSQIRLMSQIKFPREIILVVNLFEKLIDFIVTFIILIIISLLYGYYPTIAYIHLPVTIISILSLTLGISFIIGSLGVFIRDIPELTSLSLRFLFFFSGVIFSLDMLPEKVQKILVYNPLLILVESFRDIVVYGRVPEISQTVITLAISILILFFGYAFFKSKDSEFVDYL